MIPSAVRIRGLSRLGDASGCFVPFVVGGLVVHVSLPEPSLGWWAAAAGRGGGAGFDGYLSLELPVSASGAVRAAGWALSGVVRRSFPWQAELDPFVLLAHSYRGEVCPAVGGVARSVAGGVLGSGLGRLPGLAVARRGVEDPVVALTCPEGVAWQEVADGSGRQVWFPAGTAAVLRLPDGAGGVFLVVYGPGAGRGGGFGSVYPRGPAGDAVRWALRSRFGPGAAGWLVERAAGTVPAGARPLVLGGGISRCCRISTGVTGRRARGWRAAGCWGRGMRGGR